MQEPKDKMLGNSIQAEKSSEQNGSIQWGLQNMALHQKGKPSIFFFKKAKSELHDISSYNEQEHAGIQC